MRLLVGPGPLIALAAILGFLAVPKAAEAAEYRTYVGCGVTQETPSSHRCEIGDKIGAFFETDEATEWEACVYFPEGLPICVFEDSAEENVLYVNEITSEVPGEYAVSWWVGTEEVGYWQFELVEPTPPTVIQLPPPSAAPVAQPTIPASPDTMVSTQCLRARQRLKRLRRRVSLAPDKEARLIALRKVRRARLAVRRAC